MNEQKTLKRLLVVEDQEKHIARAREVLESIPGLETVFTDNYDQFNEVLSGEMGYNKLTGGNRDYIDFASNLSHSPFVPDGVISDLFLYEKKEREDNEPVPVGILIAAQCYKEKMPFVICTDLQHHQDKCNWICNLGRMSGWPEMVDNSSLLAHYTPGQKNWLLAYERLKKIVETGDFRAY